MAAPLPNKFVFVDEAGCFTFNREPNVSLYFTICTVVMDTCDIAKDLFDLRRRLAWEGFELGEFFHATTDKQAVRDEVFKVIAKHPFKVQATLMEKCKTQDHLRTKERFYKIGYFFHFKHGVSPLLPKGSETLVTTASLGTRKEQITLRKGVDDVLKQTHKPDSWKTDFMPCHADPCLQVADYCAWAIQRKWENRDPKKPNTKSYDIIKDRITYEYDLWAHGTTKYY